MIPLAPRHRALRILCVEEHTLQRKLLEACLDILRAEVLIATRAAKAVWLFRRHPVDLVLMDIDWHCAEELAAFEEMRAVSRRRRYVPIVAVSENDCGWGEARYREVGFAALCPKPVEPMRLFEIIDEVLRDSHLPPLLDQPHRLHHGPALHQFA